MTSKRNVLGTCILRPGKKKEKSLGDLYFETWKKERKKKLRNMALKEKYVGAMYFETLKKKKKKP
jgi:hypothetical protein